MFPNQGQNPLLNQNPQPNGNAPMRNMMDLGKIASAGNVGNMFSYPFQMMAQQYQPPIMRTQSQMIPQQMPRPDPKQATIPPSYPYPLQPSMGMQQPLNNTIDDILLYLLGISEDNFILFCKLFEIPHQPSREAVIHQFKSLVLPNLLKPEILPSLLSFINRFSHQPECAIYFKEPLIPRIFNRIPVIEPYFYLLQNHPTAFNYAPIFLPPADSVCIGQFISSNLQNQPIGRVIINGTELYSTNFGEFAQYYLIKRKTEDKTPISIQVSAAAAERSLVWFVITYYSPKRNFVSQYLNDPKRSSEENENHMVRTEKCNGCPSFSLDAAVENAFNTGLLTCPFCNQSVQFDQLIFERNTMSNSANKSDSDNEVLFLGVNPAKKPKPKRTRPKTLIPGLIPNQNLTPTILPPSQQPQQQNQLGITVPMRPVGSMVQMGDMNQLYPNIPPPMSQIPPVNQSMNMNMMNMGMSHSGMGVAIPMLPTQPNQTQQMPLSRSNSSDGRLSPMNSAIPPNNPTNLHQKNSAPIMQNGIYSGIQQPDAAQQLAKKHKPKVAAISNSLGNPHPRRLGTPNEQQANQENPVGNQRIEIVPQPETDELHRARLSMYDFICAQLKLTNNEADWAECVFDKDSELPNYDSEFNMKECENDKDYLEYIDSFDL